MPFPFEIIDKIYDNETEPPRYQNTYRLEPSNPFKVDTVDRIVQAAMTNALEDVSYDPVECPKLCVSIAADIRKRVQKLNFDRHKIVVIVTIIEKASQSVNTSLGYVWDTQRDNFSTFALETRTFHAYCCVLGVYHE